MVTTSILLGAGALVLAVSETVPTLRIEPGCRAAAEQAGSQRYESCIQDEMNARAELMQSWTTFAAPDRARCSGEASLDGLDSYVDLLECLKMTKEAAEDRAQRRGSRGK